MLIFTLFATVTVNALKAQTIPFLNAQSLLPLTLKKGVSDGDFLVDLSKPASAASLVGVFIFSCGSILIDFFRASTSCISCGRARPTTWSSIFSWTRGGWPEHKLKLKPRGGWPEHKQ